ncbi:MAG: hypothetical protein EON54_10130 [Alcaligenaceae bacterium]|nr:MAG: hypothetical protein EON54_10130 [Alcaligenaceae bacterium]
MNASAPWRVARFDLWLNPVFDERISHEKDIALEVASVREDEAKAWKALEKAHVYQITAAKDELPLTHKSEI